jgi:hypothetical protein
MLILEYIDLEEGKKCFVYTYNKVVSGKKLLVKMLMKLTPEI